jgi:hypothetical protein
LVLLTQFCGNIVEAIQAHIGAIAYPFLQAGPR